MSVVIKAKAAGNPGQMGQGAGEAEICPRRHQHQIVGAGGDGG